MKTIEDLDVRGRRVLVRVDFNVPMSNGEITDDGRIRASLPTLAALADRGARLVVCSHLGRPGGRVNTQYSLAPVAVRLSQLLGREVRFAADTVGPAAQSAVASLFPGDIVLLENLRFDPGETDKDDTARGAFAAALAGLADLYVGDGFAAMHRRHASVFDVPARLPHAAGYLVQAELAALRRLTIKPEQPYVLVLGGAKVSDKLGVIKNLLGLVDTVLVGGVMAFPFLAALGHPVGASPATPDEVDTARQLLLQAAAIGTDIVLPSDLVVAQGASNDAPRRIVSRSVPAGLLGLDIGPETVKLFEGVLEGAGTVFWNGPMGVFEVDAFASGTREIARALAAGHAYTVVGGGDTGAAIRALGFTDDEFGHVSTGGGASLEYLEGRTLPGLEALERE